MTAGITAASYVTTTNYDALNRPITTGWTLATAQATPTASSATFTFGYDATNRRISQAANDNSWFVYPTVAANTNYTPNNLNQYSAVGGATQTYDGNGNLIGDGTYSYCYDAESRMTGIISAGTCASPTVTVATYAYDAQGRRKSKTVGGTTTIYVTDADNRQVLEYDGSSGATQRWYAYGAGANDVLNQIDVASSSRLTMIPDIQGSIQATLSSAGTLAKAGYLTYGENTSAVAGTFRYTGQRLDIETGGSALQPSGLYYYRARMYSPTIGRFLQADPIGYSGGGNLYAYVGNDPLNNIDPLGLDTIAVGANVSFNIPFLSKIPIIKNFTTVQLSGGVISDTSGNSGLYRTRTFGPTTGASMKLSISATYTTAPTIQDTNGLNRGIDVTAGDVIGGSVDYSTGHGQNGQLYQSFGGSAGLAAGASVTQTDGTTKVFPLVDFSNSAVGTSQATSPSQNSK